jgi:hypothetical protein
MEWDQVQTFCHGARIPKDEWLAFNPIGACEGSTEASWGEAQASIVGKMEA